MAALHPAVRPAVARAPRRAAAERGNDRAGRGAGRAPRPAARGHGGRGAAAAARPSRRVPPARGAPPVVGVVPVAAARRGRADRGSHGPRRASLGRDAAGARGQEPRLPHVVPPAGAQDLGGGIRPGDAPAVPRTGRRRHRRRHRASRRRQGGRAAPGCLDARPPAGRRRQARRADAVRAPIRRRGGRLSRAHSRARAAAARRAARPRTGRGCTLARGELPLRAGPARLREDVAGRPDGDRAHAGGEARRRHLAQPQGDPQLPPCRAARGRPARVRVRRRQARRAGDRDRVREPVHGHVEGRRCLRRPGVPARRGHRVGLLARGRRHPRGGAAARRALRRRGRAARARRRARGRDGCAVPRPARRPEPAAAGLAGLPPGGVGALGARAPPRRPRDRAP